MGLISRWLGWDRERAELITLLQQQVEENAAINRELMRFLGHFTAVEPPTARPPMNDFTEWTGWVMDEQRPRGES